MRLNAHRRAAARFTTVFGAFAGVFLAACSGSGSASSTTDTASTSSDLQAAQCEAKTFKGGVESCVATYQTCSAASGADEQACRDALLACLPDPATAGGDHHGPGRGEKGGPDGDRPPPPPNADQDGGAPPPPPPPGDPGHAGPGGDGGCAGGDGDQGRPHGDRGPHGGPHADPAALTACRDALKTCFASTTDVATCLDTARTCVKTAFDAAFQAGCDDAKAKCTAGTIPADVCTDITARCDQGVTPPADAANPPQCSQ